MVCNVDVGTATFECKFHAFVEWFTPAALDMPENMYISGQDPQGLPGRVYRVVAAESAAAVQA
eukprot:10209190-Alexandrium_andersonii.AAC.1